MAHFTFFVIAFVLSLLTAHASAATIEKTFTVGNVTVQRLCQDQLITAVNGSLPGPVLEVREGDSVIIHVINESPYNLTIHWHGVFQRRTAWADGPAYITQCPIRPGRNYTYRFNIVDQEGTLWWHAHIGSLRATVYGALIIRPRKGHSYAFPKAMQNPYEEFPIVIGEWWNGNIIDIETQAEVTGGAPVDSDAYTINGQPGDFYPCSSNSTFKMNVVQGKTYLLRIVNAALTGQHFFKIAQHNFTVVSVDAHYVNAYITDVMVIAPGQSTDIIFTANQTVGDYYFAARPYKSQPIVPVHDGTTTAIIHYEGANSSSPAMPIFPDYDDTPTAHRLYSNLTRLITGPFWTACPRTADVKMFVTIGLGVSDCGENLTCVNPLGSQFRTAASMNNVSFQLPTRMSILEAYYSNVDGIYTPDFPDNPPIEFDYTNASLSGLPLLMTKKGTRVKVLKYKSVVEIVLQNTALAVIDNHPMHLHGTDFYILAQGFGNFDPVNDPAKYNYVNPQERNTVAVPVGGWAVIRFRANNPGVWFMHCHLDHHVPWGLANVFIIEDGPAANSTLPAPPADLPVC